MENSRFLTSGEAARSLGCDRRVLLRLEAKGLLEPFRDRSGKRLYDAALLKRIERLRQRQPLGKAEAK